MQNGNKTIERKGRKNKRRHHKRKSVGPLPGGTEALISLSLIYKL
jgi:hypothetical protein